MPASTLAVLVAVHDPEVRDALCASLTRAGLLATAASDGYSALCALDALRFDLVVLDLCTPEFGSRHVIEYIRAERCAPSALILAAHAHSPALPGFCAVEAYVPDLADPDRLARLAVRMLERAGSAGGQVVRTSGTYAVQHAMPAAPNRRAVEG